LERTNPLTFLTLFNNVVINLNHFIQRLLRGDTQTNRQKVSLITLTLHKITEFYT
jgi:hypothetical protein